MGEPSLWNLLGNTHWYRMWFVSTPHGRAVPLEQFRLVAVLLQPLSFNPSWESRPSGTEREKTRRDSR